MTDGGDDAPGAGAANDPMTSGTTRAEGFLVRLAGSLAIALAGMLTLYAMRL